MFELIYFVIYIILLGLLMQHLFKNNLIINIIISFIIFMIIFINVNPYKNNENKLSILNYISEEFKPKSNYLTEIDLNNIDYPFIIKPNICTKVAKGVAVIRNKSDLDNYYINNNFSKEDLIYQNFVPYKNEVGILYEKNLITGKGKIVSVVKKNSENSDIMASCYNGVSCEDLTKFVTPELDNIIDKISCSIPNFNVGRFDIKYKDEKSLFEGKDFYILEANGTMGFDLRKGTTNLIMSNYYINRWFIHRFLYGIKNIVSFNGYNLFENFNMILNSLNNSIICDDWEKLYSRYT